jgi:hypothetical protein
MHFEVPKAKTFKEFGAEYLMIVISIVTALALEHTVQTLHHRHVASEASVKIEGEIQANIREIDTVLKHNQAASQKLDALRLQLLEGIKNKEADQALIARLDVKKNISLSVHQPALRHEAWEVAVASQAVSWMSTEQLERYSTIYASMRDVQAISGGGGNHFLDGPRMLDMASNLNMGVADPRDAYRVLGQMVSAYGSVDGNLQGLRDELSKAPKSTPHS